eukprot:CAMPEP_0167809842 /NCGR_PEP_ID=MMETSP0111_2-20121227/24035_1 /TAXON_ID=91324 /ORGANISM="Lotharella globosa, Strain CCCM811" /LENGTH=43 /DNA_ID= /DNA_START= /DNA_END= /DNA_ORIENTATION=
MTPESQRGPPNSLLEDDAGGFVHDIEGEAFGRKEGSDEEDRGE